MVRAEKRFQHGLSFMTSYTFSRNIGNTSEDGGAIYGDNQVFMDVYNRKLDRGPDALDIIHRFTWSSVYELPVKPQNRALATVIGGWNLGAIVAMQSGGAFTVTTQTNNTNSFSPSNRANLLRDGNLPDSQRTVDRWFDTSAFVDPAAYAFGNSGRGILRSDGRVNFDLSVSKNFHFGEKRYVQFRGELMNAFNHPDFAPPAHALGAPAFGAISDSTAPRQIQLGLRLVF
jgi:predicted outer membrane repeat protein